MEMWILLTVNPTMDDLGDRLVLKIQTSENTKIEGRSKFLSEHA